MWAPSVVSCLSSKCWTLTWDSQEPETKTLIQVRPLRETLQDEMGKPPQIFEPHWVCALRWLHGLQDCIRGWARPLAAAQSFDMFQKFTHACLCQQCFVFPSNWGCIAEIRDFEAVQRSFERSCDWPTPRIIFAGSCEHVFCLLSESHKPKVCTGVRSNAGRWHTAIINGNMSAHSVLFAESWESQGRLMVAEDGMDQSKWALPRVRHGQLTKALQKLERPRTKVQGCFFPSVLVNLPRNGYVCCSPANELLLLQSGT